MNSLLERTDPTESGSKPKGSSLSGTFLDHIAEPSRRDLLKASGLLLGALGLAPLVSAQGGGSGGSSPYPQGLTNYRLIHRTSMGLSQDLIKEYKTKGWKGYLSWQLGPSSIPDADCDKRLEVFTTLKMTGQQMALLTAKGDPNPEDEAMKATIIRAVHSDRQLFERAVEFWTNHFNISSEKADFHKALHDRDIIRQFALSNFADMLVWNSYSSAMMIYLDNRSNLKGKPNQNYAREIMELHTLGVNGGYTQEDIVEVARCFTGWRYVTDTADPNYGKFFFDVKRHDQGEKKVLGQTIPANGGIQDGLTVLEILRNHPSTHNRIATKLAQWFVAHVPTTSAIDAIEKASYESKWDIPKMIEAAVGNATNLRAAPLKYKRPLTFAASCVRALDGDVTDVKGIVSFLRATGHVPFGWAAPNGYPDSLNYWAGLILPRWNFATNLATNSIGGIKSNMDWLLACTKAEDTVKEINDRLFGGEMFAKDKAIVLAFLKAEKITNGRLAEALGLAMALPGSQWY